MRALARLLVPLAALVLVAGACGDDDGLPDVADDAASDLVDQVTDEGGDAGEEAEAPDEVEAPGELVLGYQVTGDPGAVVELEVIPYFDGQPQSPLRPTMGVPNDGTLNATLFTPFIESAEITVSSVQGGDAVITGIYGRPADPDDPFGGVIVEQELSSVTVTPGGEIAMLSIP